MDETERQFLGGLKESLDRTLDGKYVQPEDLVRVAKTVVDVVKELIDEVREEVGEAKDEFRRENSNVVTSLLNSSGAIEDLLNRHHETQNVLKKLPKDITRSNQEWTQAELKNLSRQVAKQIQELTNLAGDDTKVSEALSRIARLETEGEPAELIRNKLELLEGDERLDAKAVKNLPEATEKIVERVVAHSSLWTLADVDLTTPATNGQVLTYRSANNSWYPSTISSGSTLSLTTTGTSGAATYNSGTGVLNIPIYAGTTYTGTTNRITVTGSVIDISSSYIGQSSITTLGTVTSGTWNASTITYPYLGTGGLGTGTKYLADDGTWKTYAAGGGSVVSVASADGSITVTNPTSTVDLSVVKAPKWSTARNLAGNSVDGSANVAFANKFIVQGTTDTGLTGAQFLGALGSGLVKNTTTTGVLSIATAGTDYIVPASAFTTGSVPFADGSGQLSQDNTNFFWDNTNKRLGIGNAAPGSSTDITGNLAVGNTSLATYSYVGQPIFNTTVPAAGIDNFVVGSTRVGTSRAMVVTAIGNPTTATISVGAINAFAYLGTGTTIANTTAANGGGLRNRYVVGNLSNFNLAQMSAITAQALINPTTGTTTGTDAHVFHAETASVGTGSTLTNHYAFRTRGGTVQGTLTNRYAIYIDDLVGGTNRWGIYQAGASDLNFFAGNVGMATAATATSMLSLGASTTAESALNVGSGVAPTSPVNGDVWYDGSHLQFRIGATTYQLDQQPGTTYTAGTGLTLTTNTFSVNTSQNISTLSNLTGNGLIKTSGGTGALSIATAGTDYQAPISLTTTGTGAATFISNVLNIPTPTGASTTPYAETPSGTVNGSNVTFTLANTPANSSGVIVVLDGVVQRNGSGLDYTVAGATITFVAAPATGSEIFAYYNTQTAVASTPFVDVTAATQQTAVNTKYKANRSTLVTLTLPTTAALGDQVFIRGYGTGGWKLAQNASQVIHGAADTTVGTGGSLASQTRYDCVTIECVVANTDWLVINQRGTLTSV